MSTTTDVLSLFKYDPVADADSTFNITQALNNNWDKLDAAILLAIAAAGAYNPEESYAVDDYCTYKGKLRKCNTAIPDGEAWTEAHWTTTTVAAELAELSSQLSNKVDNQAKEIPSSNCNNINDLSLYRVHSGTENAFQAGEGGILLSMPWDINRQQQLSANPLGTTLAHRCKNGGIWGSWIPIANATPPEEYNLLLSDGISVQDGLSAVYSKNQFGEVVVHGDLVGQMQNGSVIATLPAGFRPIYSLEMPATCDFTAGRIQVNSAGEIRVISQLSECSSLYFLAVFVAGG